MLTKKKLNKYSELPLNPPTAQENSHQNSTRLSAEEMEFKAKTGITPIPETQLEPWEKIFLAKMRKLDPNNMPETP